MVKVTGGDKLGAVLADIARRLKSASAVEVGFMENSTYPDGTPTALVAAVQEFGSPAQGIPPRPFFRHAIAEHKGEWPDQLAKAVVAHGYDAKAALTELGMTIKSDVQESIRDTNSPPLAASTLRQRGVAVDTVYDPGDETTFGAKPLVRTGHLLNSVDFSVKE